MSVSSDSSFLRYQSEVEPDAEPPAGSDCRTLGDSTIHDSSLAGLSRLAVIYLHQACIRVQSKHLAFIVGQLEGEEAMEYLEY